jgi:hypothetical protein
MFLFGLLLLFLGSQLFVWVFWNVFGLLLEIVSGNIYFVSVFGMYGMYWIASVFELLLDFYFVSGSVFMPVMFVVVVLFLLVLYFMFALGRNLEALFSYFPIFLFSYRLPSNKSGMAYSPQTDNMLADNAI